MKVPSPGESIKEVEIATWLVKDGDYVEKDQAIAEGNDVMQVGLVLESRGVLREGMTVTLDNGKTGVITSGTFSPSLKQSIAIARIPKTADTAATVDLRGTPTPVRIISLPFVRNGNKQFN